MRGINKRTIFHFEKLSSISKVYFSRGALHCKNLETGKCLKKDKSNFIACGNVAGYV
jgi:hypothetical protein